ncbi:uncharacterized protein METZ01_LOCUS516795, partial [marine metagenome]
GVKALAESPSMSNLKKLNLYGNLVEDEGAIAIAESKTLSKLRYLFPTSNRVRKQGIEALKEARCRTRLCHLHLDDLDDFIYQDDEEDSDQINSWDELEARFTESLNDEED